MFRSFVLNRISLLVGLILLSISIIDMGCAKLIRRGSSKTEGAAMPVGSNSSAVPPYIYNTCTFESTAIDKKIANSISLISEKYKCIQTNVYNKDTKKHFWVIPWHCVETEKNSPWKQDKTNMLIAWMDNLSPNADAGLALTGDDPINDLATLTFVSFDENGKLSAWKNLKKTDEPSFDPSLDDQCANIVKVDDKKNITSNFATASGYSGSAVVTENGELFCLHIGGDSNSNLCARVPKLLLP